MTKNQFIAILNDESIEIDYDGDNALMGLQLIASYFDKNKTIITGADHDELYSVEIEELVAKKITKEDVLKLAKWNWSLSDGNEYLKCFV